MTILIPFALSLGLWALIVLGGLFLFGCQTIIKPHEVTGHLERCEQWTPFPLAPTLSTPWIDYRCEPIERIP